MVKRKEKESKVNMNVQVPKNIKSPTVIVISSGTMTGDEKSNKVYEKRLDLLEKKFNERYKKISETKNISNDIDDIKKSFTKKLEQLIKQNKSSIESHNNKLLNSIASKIKGIKVENQTSDNGEIKTFIKKIDSLEEAISKLSKNKPKTVTINKSVKLDGAFDDFLAKLQKTIRENRPRMFPSPS